MSLKETSFKNVLKILTTSNYSTYLKTSRFKKNELSIALTLLLEKEAL